MIPSEPVTREKHWEPSRIPWRFVVICVPILVALTAAVYWQTRTFVYTTYDDPQYVVENLLVHRGLTLDGIRWAFTSFYVNWHPLTWVSLMIDMQLFGAQPGPEHLVNAGMHMASSLLLLFSLIRMTGKAVRSALVAAIFAVHPLHVESVAWISERKDVLSTLFEMMALLVYVAYVSRPNQKRYALLAITFACSVMSKSMTVTFPVILLLLDYWPLRRVELPVSLQGVWPLIREKIPLIAFSVGVSVFTVFAQGNAGAMMSLKKLSVEQRIANATVSLVRYIVHTVWPSKLAFFYPLTPIHWTTFLLCGLLIVVVTALAITLARTFPYLAVGWLWYLIMLLPVIGIVQVGFQSMADRYMYLPMVGICIAIIWGVADGAAENRTVEFATTAVGIAAVAVLTFLAQRQASYWINSEVLYHHALAVTANNYVAENNLGAFLASQGRTEEAKGLFKQAIHMGEDYAAAMSNLAHMLYVEGDIPEAVKWYTESLKLHANQPPAETDLAAIYKDQGKLPEARQLLERAVHQWPDDPRTQNDLCAVLIKLGKSKEAVPHCGAAVRIAPFRAEIWRNLADAFIATGEKERAIKALSGLLALDEYDKNARDTLKRLEAETEESSRH